MPEETTCGQGLAQHADLPLLVGELMGSIADNLSTHVPGLVTSDENSQHEKQVYEHLAEKLRDAQALLNALGTEMAAHHDMPMGEHVFRALSSDEAVAALERMTRVELRLVARLQEALTEHQAMLDATGSRHEEL